MRTVFGAHVLAVLARLAQLLREFAQRGWDGQHEVLPVELAHCAPPTRSAPLLVRLFVGDLQVCQILRILVLVCIMHMHMQHA